MVFGGERVFFHKRNGWGAIFTHRYDLCTIEFYKKKSSQKDSYRNKGCFKEGGKNPTIYKNPPICSFAFLHKPLMNWDKQEA